ncbi:hypothetical protein DFH94DRAFT_685573 [Russula ochroleuca]|uniref:Uncharacterized protein n=1 Tax=Russula ochroleuca TaxID=152965 RepID=A0A9P5JXF8_9AGAM|nr:hypothetical protein DFH94DRAFT_685573 [Russula ochroleuca]
MHDGVRRGRGRGHGHRCAGAWAWVWVWVWVWAWASIAYRAETYLTQPSSEGGHMGVGEDIEDVGWHRGVKWASALWRRRADGEGEGKDWAKLGEGILVGDFSDFATYNFFFEIGMDTPVWPEFLTLTSVAS